MGNYLSIAHNQTYTSGGSAVTPVNVTAGSPKLAPVTCYTDTPTLGGTAAEFDRWYPSKDTDLLVWNEQGATIVPPGESMNIRWVGDHTSGSIFVRLSFVMDPWEH